MCVVCTVVNMHVYALNNVKLYSLLQQLYWGKSLETVYTLQEFLAFK